MKKTMLLLVGEQTLPNILPAMALKCDRILYAFTEDRYLNREIAWMQDFWRQAGHPALAETAMNLQVDPFSPEKVQEKLLQFWNAARKPSLILNHTGGTELMAMGTGSLISPESA